MANRPGYTSYRRPVPDRTAGVSYGKLPGLRNEMSGTVTNGDVKTVNALPPDIHTDTTKSASASVDTRVELPQPAPRRVPQAQDTSAPAPAPATTSEPVQVLPKPITNEEFQAMIPARFLQPSSTTDNTSEAAGPTVTVTIKQPENSSGDIKFPPAPTTLGKVTETITKSTFTETVVTRVTDNKEVLPVIIEVS